MVRGHNLVPRFGPRVTDVLKQMLRPAMIPSPGHAFVVADWSAIEGRVNPWLASSPAGDAKLDIYRNGLDPYIFNAAATYGATYDAIKAEYEAGETDKRMVGKVQELALAFGGGVGAFAAMGRGYGVRIDEAQARRIVDAWRRANPWAPAFWSDLERAYMSAMRHPGHEFTAGRITYVYDRQHLWYMLPSGRVLCYPYARIEGEDLTYAKAAWKPAADATEWPRARLWRGLACENVTQATAHDILRRALRELDVIGQRETSLDVCLHVHDEVVLETSEPEVAKAELERIMTTPPEWAPDLPLAVEAKVMERYGK
jgi:DNA polymerase